MLSAVVQRLHGLQTESSPELRQATIDLCVSAFPDVQPWQVKAQCCGISGTDEEASVLADLHYSYLSLLLHPVDGHERSNQLVNVSRRCVYQLWFVRVGLLTRLVLIQEWCELSIQRVKREGRTKSAEAKANFFAVASRASSNHTAYHRDLVHLLMLSMNINEIDLALDLGMFGLVVFVLCCRCAHRL